jgi:hypothetical protein
VFFKGGLHTHNEYAASGKGTMEIKEQYPFQFFDQVFDIYLTDDKQFMVPLRPLCEILGLSIGAQLSRIKRDVIMAEHLHTLRPKIVGKKWCCTGPRHGLSCHTTAGLFYGRY